MPVLIDNAETLSVATYTSGDGWTLDYSKLTLSDQGGAPVPEPSTVFLFGLGLIGLAGSQRKRFINKK